MQNNAPHKSPDIVTRLKFPTKVLPGDEIKKIRDRLGNCSENTMETTIRATRTHVGSSAIQEGLRIFGLRNAIPRIAHPDVACWVAKYNGEIAAIDIISSFPNCTDGESAREYAALFARDKCS